MLSGLRVAQDDRVLIDYRTSDDAGVYVLDETRALVQTVDFFTPIVDDPYLYGQITAANSLSDVYAMGGTPLTALAVAGFPAKDFDAALIPQIFTGGFDKLREAGVALLGGHTVQDPEVKFGYAVTGIVHPKRVWPNSGARPGDALVLTKAIGTGIITTAMKFGRSTDNGTEAAIESMRTLNATAARVAAAVAGDVMHACTDITGFAIFGHMTEMALGSGVTIRLDAPAVPILPDALSLALRNRTGGGGNNLAYFGKHVEEPQGFDDNLRGVFYDPQTSGGLLFSLSADRADVLVAALRAAGVTAARVGDVVPARPGTALVVTQ